MMTDSAVLTSTGGPRERVVREFAARHGAPAAFIARGPGRVNLIGDHTDYNDGFVLPMAIDRAVWIALRPRRDGQVVVYSVDFGETREFDSADEARRDDGWVEYIRGVAWALGQSGRPVCGWDGVTMGDVPVGAGLSSSAALELAAARAFAASCSATWEPAEMALLAQRAENEWVGVNCGIMDQLISATGEAGHAMLIDCRSLETRAVPLPRGATVVILDTATRRGLVGTAYNERRSQCEAAAAVFGVPALRDVDLATFERRGPELNSVTRRRARHVITENARVLDAAEALTAGDVHTVGRLMTASHESLRDDFEVSRDELDIMADLASALPGCYGARMTGAGFGGCAVALVDGALASAFSCDVAQEYERATGLRPAIYVCTAAQGASVERA
jgi:galactokinase